MIVHLWNPEPRDRNAFIESQHVKIQELKFLKDSRRFVTFFAQNLWTFVPWLYREILDKDFPPDERSDEG